MGEDRAPNRQPERKAVAMRQGTGPRAVLAVLVVSLILAVAAGVILVAYFYG